ncbi:MAG: hypothetical protein ACJ75B_16820 [Flavisolibacter sp.]|jgi:hypothetical protein
MKKILIAALILGTSFRSIAAGPIVNEKVLNAFNKTFQNVQNVTWTESEFIYEVSFKQEQVTSKVVYDKQGNILNTLRYYKESQLPIMILTRVKQRFADKKIFGVTEQSSDEGTYYYITLEGEKTWTNIKADNYGSITVENKFRKG